MEEPWLVSCRNWMISNHCTKRNYRAFSNGSPKRLSSFVFPSAKEVLIILRIAKAFHRISSTIFHPSKRLHKPPLFSTLFWLEISSDGRFCWKPWSRLPKRRKARIPCFPSPHPAPQQARTKTIRSWFLLHRPMVSVPMPFPTPVTLAWNLIHRPLLSTECSLEIFRHRILQNNLQQHERPLWPQHDGRDSDQQLREMVLRSVNPSHAQSTATDSSNTLCKLQTQGLLDDPVIIPCDDSGRSQPLFVVVPSRRPRIEGRHASQNGTTWKAKTNKFAAGIFQRKELCTGSGLNVKKTFFENTHSMTVMKILTKTSVASRNHE